MSRKRLSFKEEGYNSFLLLYQKKLLVLGKSAKPLRFPKDQTLLPTDYDIQKSLDE